MAKKRLEWISVSSLIAVITFGIVMGTISLGSKGSKPTGSDNKTKQTDVKEKKADKSKKKILIMIATSLTASMRERLEVIVAM